jgi:hypothetical protein
MPRRYRQSRAAIHDRESANRDHLEPRFVAPLTPDQIREKRLELCEEMLSLLLGDVELAARSRQALQTIYTSLGNVRRQL